MGMLSETMDALQAEKPFVEPRNSIDYIVIDLTEFIQIISLQEYLPL